MPHCWESINLNPQGPGMREQVNKVYFVSKRLASLEIIWHINNRTNMHSAAEYASIQTQFVPLPRDRFIQNRYPVAHCLDTSISHSCHIQLQGWSTAQLHAKKTPECHTRTLPDKAPWICEIFLLEDEGLNISHPGILPTSPHGHGVCAGKYPNPSCVLYLPHTQHCHTKITYEYQKINKKVNTNSDGIRHVWMEQFTGKASQQTITRLILERQI